MNRIKKLTAVFMAIIMAALSTSIASADTVSKIEGVPAGDYTYIRDKMQEGINMINGIYSLSNAEDILDHESGLLQTNVVNPLMNMVYNSNNTNTKIFCLDVLLVLNDYQLCLNDLKINYYSYLENHPEVNTYSNLLGFYNSDYYKQNLNILYNSYKEMFTYNGTLQGFEDLLNYKANKLRALFGNQA